MVYRAKSAIELHYVTDQPDADHEEQENEQHRYGNLSASHVKPTRR